MTKPRLLDLFSGAGGAARGYQRAGFYVVGVDVNPQPRYAGDEFIQGDAMTFPLEGFDVIHASPPCQKFSITANLARAQGKKASDVDLLTPIRERLIDWGGQYIIENVKGAPMRDPIVVCGQSEELGMRVRRHRLFESNLPLVGTTCAHKDFPRPVGIYYSPGDEIPSGGKTAVDLADGQDAMGIDWMKWGELKESIPPAFAEHVGRQIIRAFTVAA